MIAYLKSFKDYIPTWVICIFVFFWVFVWPLVVAVILCVIQRYQKQKLMREHEEIKIKLNVFTKTFTDEHGEILDTYDNIKRLKTEQEELDNFFREKNIENETLIFQKTQELEQINEEINYKKKKVSELQTEEKRLKNHVSKSGKPSEKSFYLTAGKYKGGIDIPIGVYNMRIVFGSCFFEINKPEYVCFNMSSNSSDRKKYNYTEAYQNLEISEKSIIKINGSSKIEFVLSKKYDYSREMQEMKANYALQEETLKRGLTVEKTMMESEILSIRQELKILNDECIKKYYVFSHYDGITSEECKSKLLLLKQEEKELREKEKDVIYTTVNTGNRKTKERYVRQVLRTFNAECDNIMLSVKKGNVDACRKKVQNSYLAANRLFSIDGVSLSKDLLNIKFKEIELMYTYELKYQQEKEIQRAIKEQMIEEAKAEREIQEQKKKIEKDLQQHLGEVNRLMKYLQKTQVDVEKQLYMDKIRELEDKIKELQSDQKAVLEREANAKAGFVYIISNIGSFGEDIYKIGMTRRLEPMDRIHELSSASVPFEFDVHAMIFSSDAPELENSLHRHFADRRVNKVNPRKEFYNVDIDEIEKVVKENFNDTVNFTKIPVATEYRQSLSMGEATI